MLKLSLVLMALSVIGHQVRATKGDVERALELLNQARAAIGGETAIGAIQNLSLTGKSRRSHEVSGQSPKELNGEFELHMALPDRLIRMEKLTLGGNAEGHTASNTDKVVRADELKFKVQRRADAQGSGSTVRSHESAELARYTLGLLLTPPPSFNASYRYLGEGDAAGVRCDIIGAEGANGFSLKLYLDKSSHLPVMMNYRGAVPRIPRDRIVRADGAANSERADEVIVLRRKDGEGGAAEPPRIFFERKGDGAGAPAEGHRFMLEAGMMEDAEIQILFSDFRPVAGVLLPHVLTQVVNGQVSTVWNVDGYEVNSPTINEKFNGEFHLKSKQN